MPTFLCCFIILFSSFLRAAPTDSFLLADPQTLFSLQEKGINFQNHSIFLSRFSESRSQGMTVLKSSWGDSSFEPRAARYLLQKDRHYTFYTNEFLRALEKEKPKLMRIFRLKNDTYNKLAAMAFGILGVESKFGENLKYSSKERAQWLVTMIKNVQGSKNILNSRGLTQIKSIPLQVQKNYPEISSESLSVPSHSAVATLGFLAETLKLIRGLQKNQLSNGIKEGDVSLSYINEDNIFDYIPYIYSGRMKKIFKDPSSSEGATVRDNLYIQEMKFYMKRLLFLEKSS